MNVALIYPPTCDPTAPYLSLPALAAALRDNGCEPVVIDANIGAYDWLLRRETLTAMAERIERRLSRLERQAQLTHQQQLLYARFWEGRRSVDAIDRIAGSVDLLRGKRGGRFYDYPSYIRATETVGSALRLISAAYAPVSLSFTAYRAPFSLLSMAEIERDAAPESNPFYEYFEQIIDQLAVQRVQIAGISTVFPGQIQPAYSLAFAIRRALPHIHVTAGGPALTQLMVRQSPQRQARILGPFHSAVLFEGEQAIVHLVRTVERGQPAAGIIIGDVETDLGRLPVPDFSGLPLASYLSPEPILPYDAARGCYWGKCAFCHYGLADKGTAPYRERPIEMVIKHLAQLSERYGSRIFYLSEDTLAPAGALRLARAINAEGKPWRWGTDMRPERALTPDVCNVLAAGGLLSVALGVESAAPRVLALIDKGSSIDDMSAAAAALAGAGVAVEAMCITGFPSETNSEALATVRFLAERRDIFALFVFCQFALMHGSRVSQRPADYGVSDVWQLRGDEFGTALFYTERPSLETGGERDQLDIEIGELSRHWQLGEYPWAGSLSTAHTLLYYDHYGPGAFRRLASVELGSTCRPVRVARRAARFNLTDIEANAPARDAEIWNHLIHELREVGREPYERLADALPCAQPAASWRRVEAEKNSQRQKRDRR